MSPVCAIVFASICVSPPYATATKTWSMVNTPNHFVAGDARRKGIEIEIGSSDELTSVAAASMNRICRRDWCVYYRRHCDVGLLSCSWAYSVEAPDTGEILLANSMDIHARSRATMTQAKTHLWVIQQSQDQQPTGFIPLTELDQSSPSTKALFCSSRIRIQGCKPPRRPVL
jgi:hypothetical protein